MPDVLIPVAENDPVAVALNDPVVRDRLMNAARAFLGRRGFELTSTERTAEAEALTQEAAARALARRDQFDASRDIVKWLVGFVINVGREFAKRRCRDATGPEDCPGVEELAVDSSRPVDEVISDKLLVSHLLEQLCPIDQQIVQLKHWQEMTCAKIGEQIGMHENAVRVRHHRAVQKLKHACRVSREGQP